MVTGLQNKPKELIVTETPESGIGGIEDIYWTEKTRAIIEHMVKEINDKGIHRSIAIIAAQGGGKNLLLGELRERCTRSSSLIICKPGVLEFDIKSCEDADTEVVFVKDCQNLFSRRIGGYEGLKTFLEWVTTTDKTVVTNWNLFSWHYRLEAKKIKDYFPDVYEIPPRTPAEITELLLGRYGESVEYIDDDQSMRISLKYKKCEIKTGEGGRTFRARLPTLRIKRRSDKKEGREALEAVAKDITELSYGYPGLAFTIFEACFTPPRFNTGKLGAVRVPVDLTFDEMFYLLMILGHQETTYNELLKIAQDKKALDLALFKMLNQSYVIKSDDGLYSINMIVMYSIVEQLKKARLVW